MEFDDEKRPSEYRHVTDRYMPLALFEAVAETMFLAMTTALLVAGPSYVRVREDLLYANMLDAPEMSLYDTVHPSLPVWHQTFEAMADLNPY